MRTAIVVSFILGFVCVAIICCYVCTGRQKIATCMSEGLQISRMRMSEGLQISRIPRTIVQTCKSKAFVPSFVFDQWRKLNPSYEYHLFDDDDCISFLDNTYGKEHAELFQWIRDGPIKADFWRVCVIFHYGGIYVDIDAEPLLGFADFLGPETTFYTHETQRPPGEIGGTLLNPHVLGAVPGHPILSQCIDKYIELGRTGKDAYDYFSWSIVGIMTTALNEYMAAAQEKDKRSIHLSHEICPDDLEIKFCYISDLGTKVFNTRHAMYDCENHSY
jgi:hypothetical protein